MIQMAIRRFNEWSDKRTK